MSSDDSKAQRALAWWGEFSRGGKREDAGAFARLRRAHDAIDALIEPTAIDLVRRLGTPEGSELAVCRAAELASLLAHVRENDEKWVASQLKGANPDTPLMSSIRFQRLLQAEAGSERLTAFRRAIVMLGGRANVKDLTRIYLNIDHPEYGRSIRIRWMLRYAGQRQAEVHPDSRSEPATKNSPEDAA